MLLWVKCGLLGAYRKTNNKSKGDIYYKSSLKNKDNSINNATVVGMASIEGRATTNQIAKDLEIIFRQNKDPFNKGNINCPFQNDWKQGDKDKKAVVYFSRNTLNLLIIPKIIIDKYIFEQFYQKNNDSYFLTERFKNMNYDRNRLSLHFRKSNDNFVIIYIQSTKEYDQQFIAFKIPLEFWSTIEFKTENYKKDLIKEIQSRINHLSNRISAVVPIEKYGRIEDYI